MVGTRYVGLRWRGHFSWRDLNPQRPSRSRSFWVRWNFIFPFSWALTENVIFNTFSCTQMNYNFLTDICIEHTFWSEPALLNWRPAVQWSFPHNGECSLKNVCSLSGRPLSFAWIKHAICFTYFYHLLPLSQISHLIWKSIHRNLGIKKIRCARNRSLQPSHISSAVKSTLPKTKKSDSKWNSY